MVSPRTSPAYWQKESGEFQPFKVRGNPFASVLEKFLPVNPQMSCVEVGAYPGAYLCWLAKRFGYRPVAIEYRDDADDIRRLFEFNDMSGPEIIQQDFLELGQRQFDVVTSFGFVEHFDNPQEVLQRHADLVKPGGYLVVSVPHFWGMQGLLRRLVLTREALEELFATHNLDIMRLGALKAAIEKAGLEVLFGRYVMNGQFWIAADSPKVRNDRRGLARLFSHANRMLGSRLPSCFLYSPMALVIARKVET